MSGSSMRATGRSPSQHRLSMPALPTIELARRLRYSASSDQNAGGKLSRRTRGLLFEYISRHTMQLADLFSGMG